MKQKLIILLLVLLGVFVLAGCGGKEQTSSSSAQSLTIQVTSGGYSPEVLEVKKGNPVILNFQAASSLGCAGDLEIPDFGVRQSLAPDKTTPVKILPKSEGDFVIRCSMNMFTATLKVRS